MDSLNRAYGWAAHRLHRFRAALGRLRLDPAELARRQAEWDRMDREFARNPPNVSPWSLLWVLLFIATPSFLYWAFSPPFLVPEQHTTLLSWTLDPTSPYHVVTSLPGEAFTHAQVTKLDIGWEAAPFPAGIDDGGWRGRAIEPINFYPFQDKVDPHYHDLVAKKSPDDRGVGVALGHNAGIVEFIAAIYIYDPEDRKSLRTGGALIERVALSPGAKGGDRLSLPRLLKEGWVVIGKEEVEESEEAAKQRKREERRYPSRRSSSGGYAWDEDKEFEGHKEGGWKGWAPKPGYDLFKIRGNPENRGAIPVLTLRHRSTGTLLKANQEGDAWVVNTLVEDNRPEPQAWWKRIFWAVVYYIDSRFWWDKWLWPKIVIVWQNTCEAVGDWFVGEFR